LPYSLYTSKSEVENCYYSGFYCADTNELYSINDGRIIIEENIRQKCIYNYSMKVNKDSLLFVQFMNKFYATCMVKTNPKFNKECHDSVVVELNMPQSELDKCYEDSFLCKIDIIKI